MANVKLNNLWVDNFAVFSDPLAPGCIKIIDMPIQYMLDEAIANRVGIEKIGKIEFDFGISEVEDNMYLQSDTLEMVWDNKNAEYACAGKVLCEKGGIKIYSVGLMEDPLKYCEDVHWLLVAENNSQKTITIDFDYDSSCYVNGFQAYSSTHDVTVSSGGMSLIDIKFSEFALGMIKIESIEEIEDIEMGFSIEDEARNSIAEVTVSEKFSD